ncbi:EAL domain-containing protein [Robertmurraya kyonggiensis]|uniref:EAL domain-containing protein n=1 Tax=Robertmurraya kyonggiensis TaxID=1037680 RepID=A0A4U1DCW4_9BACI|nr:EAL domain-containing protein [Robertmurraya kyonggiensis]TKC19286.1 EAL domain-containing protein [Robertmurraya kyonggiensis]
MSIKKKLPILFTILVLLILIANNMHHFFRAKNSLLENYDREISLLAQQVSYQVENAKNGSEYVENIVGRELRTASIAIRNSLPTRHEDVTNEQLVELAKELKISHITLLAQTEDDIVGVKSSDPHEIGMSTKEWGYWYDAFQQLFAREPVTVEEGLTLKDYWSGPIEIASSNPDHTDKWGYYFDGRTNYIIDPYYRDDEILEYEKRFGPTNIMEQVTNQLEGVLELSVFNPESFGNAKKEVYLNGNSFIRISEQSIWYGSYDYANTAKDQKYIQSALATNEVKSYNEVINGKDVRKAFVPINESNDGSYVIGFVYDNAMIDKELYKELEAYLFSSLFFMIIVLFVSFIFSNSITKPIALIVDHVNEIAQGTFGKKLVLNRKDELGHLVANVNELSRDLKTYVDDLKESQEVIKFQAYHDPLTSLPNRRFIQEKLSDLIHEASQNDHVIGVIFIDIDRFKHVNDSMGHKMGDQLIKLISERIKEFLIDYKCVVARQGGDEFIILTENLSEEQVREMTHELILHIRKPYDLGERDIYVGSSCGISFYPHHTKNMEQLIINADIAMYAAKKQGGNRFVVYDPNESNVSLERIEIEASLRKAIEDEVLDVFYQPKMNAASGKIIGAEALVRWNDVKLGFVSPAVFIPIAEDSGLIQPLFELVLRKAMIQMKEWNDVLVEKLTVSVNVSAVQFMEARNLVDCVKDKLSLTQFAPELLELEITESALLNNMSETIEALEEFNQLGISISIDDFGTGYSSLSYLQKLPIDTLKIDQSFIKSIDENGSISEIANGIINLARSLKLGIIAEGVEEEYQKEYLIRNGCHLMQGYLFSKPLEAKEFHKFIKDS